MAAPARCPPQFSYKYRGGPRETKERKKRDPREGEEKRKESKERGKEREGRTQKKKKKKEQQRREQKTQRRERRKTQSNPGHPTVSTASCRHQQLRHRRQPPQVSPLPLISFYCSSSCMQNVHYARSASHELITRLLCMPLPGR